MNSDIKKFLDIEINNNPSCKTHKAIRNYIYDFWEDKEELLWEDLCEFAQYSYSNIRVYRIALGLIIGFLEGHLYHGEFEEKLYRDLDWLKYYYNYKYTNCSISSIFTKNYNDVCFIKKEYENSEQTGYSVRVIYNGQSFYSSLYIKYLETVKISENFKNELDYNFMIGVDKFQIESLDDITSDVFWAHVKYFKDKYKNSDDYLKSLKNLCRFYKWLLVTFNDHEFFKDSTSLTYELLLSNVVLNQIKANAYFTTFSTTEDVRDKPRIVYIVKNFQNKSTTLKKTDYFTVNIEIIKESYYRTILNKYIQNSIPVSLITNTGQISYISKMLSFIEQVKKHKNYPNPNIKKFVTPEATMIRDYCKSRNISRTLASLNNEIGSIRRFLQWCVANKYIECDLTFFDYLSQYEEPNKFTGDAIPDKDLTLINKEFILYCKEDPSIKIYYAIFLLLIETEFRISQICNLTVNAIQPTLKQDQYLIYSNTKTSNGKKVAQPICLSTKRIIDSVIEETEELRKNCIKDSLKDHIFIYYSTINSSVAGINSNKFLTVFNDICKKANVRKYTAKNLRDTHMTKAFEFILKNKKSDLELSLLSKHKTIDTTKSHYIEMELTKMLESTYQVTLGNRDINQQCHILNDLPTELKNNESIVENGCGHCTAKTCMMNGSLPCLVCEHFVTTVEHKPYFIKMIDNCNYLLNKATIKHEIEDLTLIKTLYINWLREICIIEEENICLDNQ